GAQSLRSLGCVGTELDQRSLSISRLRGVVSAQKVVDQSVALFKLPPGDDAGACPRQAHVEDCRYDDGNGAPCCENGSRSMQFDRSDGTREVVSVACGDLS